MLYVNANEMPWILDDGGRAAARRRAARGGAASTSRTARPATASTAAARPRRAVPPLAERSSCPAREGRRRATHREGQGRDAVRSPILSRATGERSWRSSSATRRRAGEGSTTRETAQSDALHAHRLQPLPRPRRLSRREAAVGHPERDRPRTRGEIDWQIPLGEVPELTRARRSPRPAPRTTAARSSPRAASSSSARPRTRSSAPSTRRPGKLLWETTLPAGGYATPATYEVNGKQYVVIAAGGGKMGTKSGDAYVAFALPD